MRVVSAGVALKRRIGLFLAVFLGLDIEVKILAVSKAVESAKA